jgi:glycosyltransferase involved in cell wall biosynthesis
MKILHFVHNYYGFSGASKQASNIASNINESSVEIEQRFFTFSIGEKIDQDSQFFIHSSSPSLLARCFAFTNILCRYKPDIVHFHGADFALLFVCKLFRVKVYWKSTLFGSDDFVTLSKGTMGFVKKKLIRFIDLNNTLTKQMYFNNAQILKPSKLVTIPNGVAIKEHIANKDKIAIIVSAIIPRKSVYEGIDFFNKQLHKHGYKLYIIGPNSDTLDGFDPNYYKSCLSIANENVVFLGELSQPDVFTYFKNAHFLIHLSKQEGMPNVVLEAMSFSVFPIITSMDGLADELIEHGVTGVNVDASLEFDIDLFIGSNSIGREFVKNKNSFKVVAEQTIDVYQKLLNI